MSNILNLDLLSVGIAVAATILLGFSVFFNNRKSITNRAFLLFSFITALWGAVNYLSYGIKDPAVGVIYLQATLALGVWQAFTLFELFYVFPRDNVKFPLWHVIFLPIFAGIASFLCFTKLVFEKIAQVAPDGKILEMVNGPGMGVFGVVSIGFVLSGIVIFIRKGLTANAEEKVRFRPVIYGTIIMFALIITFNFIFPAILNNSRFIPFGAVFILPFVAATAYAIFKHHLFNTRVISTEIFTFLLAIFMFFEIILSSEIFLIILRSGIFILILSFGTLLVRSVRREVEQREQLEKLSYELQETNAKLTELSTFKSQLLSLASHQIKSPLAVIKGFTDILLEGLYGPMTEKVKTAVLKIRHSTDDLISLINTLLDLRRVDEGKMEFQFTKINFLMQVGALVEQLRPLAVAKSIEMKFSGDECMVKADEQKLRQVIQNLVDNAIKYTPSGHIDVSVTDKGATTLFAVEDSGLGISPTLLPHLFEEFVRDDRVKKQIRGTGLGLYIARRIVEAHGGKIWGESAGEGKGSRFCVELPKYVEGDPIPAAPVVAAPMAARKP